MYRIIAKAVKNLALDKLSIYCYRGASYPNILLRAIQGVLKGCNYEIQKETGI